jgi:phosphoglycolate phosphatase
MSKRVLLFDIDGTLVCNGDAGRGAMMETLREDFDIDRQFDIPFSGRTDRFLLHALLQAAGLESTSELQGKLRLGYGRRLLSWIERSRGKVLPGVQPLLAQLQAEEHVLLGVMTGNLPETARIKLDHYALSMFFGFGVYGDVHCDRNDVAREARRMLIDRLGAFDPQQTIVIGDTPLDVACAHAIGARCLAACTGLHSRNELLDAKADWIVDDLSQTDEVFDILCHSSADRM